MTNLPNLPSNLDPTCISCGSVSALTAPLTAGLAGQAAQVQGAIAGQTAGAQALIAKVSATTSTTRVLIEAAISTDVIDGIISQYTLPDGTYDIKCVADELIRISNKLNEANTLTINALQIPPVSVGGLLRTLIPTIEPPDIPSPAEIRGYVVELIERKKVERQKAIVKLQKAKAQADTISFV